MFGARATAASLKILGFLFAVLLAFLFPYSSFAVDPGTLEKTGPVQPFPEIRPNGPFALDTKLEPRVKFWVDI